MIAVLCFGAMLLSCVFSLVLKKQEVAILLALFAFSFIFYYNKEMPHYVYLIPSFCGFLSVASNGIKYKAFWFLLSWFVAYYFIIIFFGPYSKPISGWVFRTGSLIFLFLWTMLIKWDRKKILFIVIAYSSYWLVWGFLEKLIINPVRIGGPWGVATGYAMLLSIIWAIWFVDFCRQDKKILISIIVTCLVLLAIIFSGSRIGIFGMCIGILLGIYSYTFKESHISIKSRSIKFFMVLFVISIFSIIAWNTFMKDFLIARTMGSILHGKIDTSNMGRVVAWISAYDTFYNNKIWGSGPDTFSAFYSNFLKNFPYIGIHQKSLPHAHNEILQVLSELGLFGFLHLSVVVIFCLYSIIAYMKEKKETICHGLIAGFLVFFALAIVDCTPSFGFIPWLMGVMASFHFSKNIGREEICLQK